jgi:hypothetical protein
VGWPIKASRVVVAALARSRDKASDFKKNNERPLCGTQRTYADASQLVAFCGKADIRRRIVPFNPALLTLSGH